MDEPYQEKHGAYLLKCAPLRLADGRYMAHLLAIRLDRTGTHDIVVPLPPSDPFSLPSIAAEFALSYGKRWLRERLMPSTTSQ